MTGTDKKKISRRYLRLVQDKKIEYARLQPEQLVSRFSVNLNLPKSVEKMAAHIARRVKEMGLLESRSPLTIMACSIFLASQVSNFSLISLVET